MKANKKSIYLLFILISLIFIGFFSINTKGISDLTFTFDDNVLFNSDISTFNDSFNLKNSQEYTEIYNATNSFTNDIIGNTPLNWIDNSDINANGTIVNLIDGHSKVLYLYDNNNSGIADISTSFLAQVSGTIEFWIRSTDISKVQYFRGTESGNQIFVIRFFDSAIDFHDGGSWIELRTALSNTWYHFTIDFECSGAGYLGLSSDSNNIYINSVLEGSDVSFSTPTDNVDGFGLFTIITNLDYGYYLDAFGVFFENFDFEGSTIGSEPLLWDIDPIGGTSIATVERFQESNVLKVIDDDTINNIHVDTEFSQSIDQSIEYYIAINDTSLTDWYYMRFLEGGTGRVLLRIDNNDLDFHNGVMWSSVKDDFIIINTWFKITINLHDSINTFDIFIDDILEGSNLGFITNSIISVNRLSFESGATEISITYLDNFEINSTNFRNYYINLNFLPYIDISQTLQEVDKYEFAMSDINTLREIGSSTYGTWTESDVGGGQVQIKAHPTDSNNRVVEIDTFSGGDVKGLVKNNFSLTGNFVNITVEFEIIAMSGSTSYNIVAIESSDGNTIVGFIMWHNGSLGWFPDISSAGVPLRNDLTIGKVYILQVLLNYELDIFILDWFIDGIYNTSYIKPLITTGKSGLKEIFIRSHWVDSKATMELYNVGVYENGVSESKEIGWSVIDLQVSDWNPKIYNLFNILGNGQMNLGIISGNYSVGENFSGFDDTINLNNVSIVLNLYDSIFFNLSNPSIVFSIFGGNFSTSHLKIDGVKLIEGSNVYPLIFESSGVNIDEGYFYVIGNKLRFYHISDDSNLEFIQARFNINDISSEGYLTSFRSNIDNNAKGFFRVNFTSTSNLIQMPIIETITRFILTQNRTIHDLVVLITDNNINSITGLTEGFIHQIELLQVENLLISVITTSLIAMMIPLLIILIPTLAISNIYGKELIIPMFIFISLVLTFTGIIPIWLFFIIAISNSVFIIKKRKEMS